IHAGCAALALAYAPDDDDEAFGAPAIEIRIELAAPRLEATDLPPGPDGDAAAASPSVIEQEKVAEQTDLPKATPTETDDPDRVVTPDSQKPQDEPKVETVQAAPSELSIAAEATATPTIETAPEAPRFVAPVQGTGESARRVRVTWERELAAHLD